MRLARTSLALTLALMVAPAGPIYADPSDLTKITCKQLADSGEDDSAIILVLIYGFILGKEDKPAVDPKKMDADVERFQNACDKTPDATAMSVATETFSR
ncbi:MAG: HdeA family protein [Pseudomonadota bacterium]|nr:HdeA family protein [Pseudomonadota bacterium]